MFNIDFDFEMKTCNKILSVSLQGSVEADTNGLNIKLGNI